MILTIGCKVIPSLKALSIGEVPHISDADMILKLSALQLVANVFLKANKFQKQA